MTTLRCAIYTRKSSDEGLEQSFNSLDAQHEACSAYILSQASHGWCEVEARYDDGGLSGGTLERPALQRLLADVAAGRIDIIVVYKVDRLTRSLLDFAKLVEAFDRANTSFVSVTQSFNTTTSMGRLTLNMLLSFAQFEREVTAERFRDKIAASKARGMWMGGTPPLGYRPDGRSLAVVEERAALVRHVFERYRALGTVRLLEAELKQHGIRVPERATAGGKPIDGGWFSRGVLYLMLRRVTYNGRIAHGDKSYPGTHPAIIPSDTFQRVQAMLSEHVQGTRSAPRASNPSLLAGSIVDDAGEPLVATHATKGKARYRYYVSRAPKTDSSSTGLRVPAREIERVVADRLATQFDDRLALTAAAWLDVPADRFACLAERRSDIAAGLRRLCPSSMGALVAQVRIADARVHMDCRIEEVAKLLACEQHEGAPALLALTAEVRLTRSGTAMRLVQRDGSASTADVDSSLTRQLLLARTWWKELRGGEIDITRLATLEGLTPSYVTRVLRLAFLAPSVTQAILAGRLRAGVSAATLTATGGVDASWRTQEARLLPTPTGAGTRRA
ncbi:recombinase family protein [Sphingomonas sp. RRHST34]|uniref:Recombinase family protein n=1 Tax=Sphingomonas citri TaxID=2862499 RepID=A0ABS7BQB5_9SPHN|nr:recombinase family protein [Sphingomonas citri]MBW6531795.1 recombinase family protein [Sphingomonas citri]